MNLTDLLQKINEIDLNNLELENIGSWPIAIRATTCVLIIFIVFGLGYQFHLSGLQSSYKVSVNSENDLKEQYRIKAFQSANLIAYREQMVEMKESFGALVRQLPSDTEVPGLLEDITITARNSGLQIEEIKLQDETVTEFYIELPISISVIGSYHDLGNFVSGVASLSRIVTLHDFNIKPSRDGDLSMNILAKTYRYNDKESK